MAKTVYTDISITINSVDLSDHLQSLTLDTSISEVDITAMGDAWDQAAAGRKKVSGTATFYQDFDASSVHATLSALVGSTTTIAVLPTSAAVGATNPSFTITNALVTGYGNVSGTYGDAAMVSLSFSSGTLAIATS